jgi:hypothetical protein
MTRQGAHHTDPKPKPHSRFPQNAKGPTIWRSVAPYLVVIVLAGVPFCMGKYFEFNSPEPFDGGAYLYSANHILHGAKIGVEERPSAHIGTLLVNMLAVKLFGFQDIGPKILQGVLQAIALIVMFLTLRRVWGLLGASLSVIVASVYLSAPAIAKYGNVKEQYMIVFMILGVCCFLLYQLNNRWWLGFLGGAFLVWAPMFKPTGLSAAGAVGLFVLLQPVLKNRTLRQAGVDLGLLVGGGAVAIAPVFIWILGWRVQLALPYYFLVDFIAKRLPASHAAGAVPQTDYVAASHQMMPFSELAPRILRYYMVVILPIVLALGAILVRIVRWLLSLGVSRKVQSNVQERFILLLAVWWLLDMGFIWVSAHSYEQYYLPLNASAAMLGGYLAFLYAGKLHGDPNKPRWVVLGLLGLILMMILSWQIFFGIHRSPFSNTVYTNQAGQSAPRNGYLQKWEEISVRRHEGRLGAWEYLGQYIREHSEPNDTIYVWGWYPGIYVVAQRMAPTVSAFEGSMHTISPEELSARVTEDIEEFKKNPPKFIVDSYKIHFPFNRPPLELWPQVTKGSGYADQSGFLRTDPAVVKQYEQLYAKMLAEKWPDEARRFEAMKPFRDYVMQHYRVVGKFGDHVLFQRKS